MAPRFNRYVLVREVRLVYNMKDRCRMRTELGTSSTWVVSGRLILKLGKEIVEGFGEGGVCEDGVA